MTLGLTFTFVGLSRLAEMPWLQDVEPLTPELAVCILTLHRTYYLVDVMLLYTLLLVVSPLAMLLLTTGRTWAAAALLGRAVADLPVVPAQAPVPWPIVNNDTFRVAAWQVWFFGGMTIGYHRVADLGRLASALSPAGARRPGRPGRAPPVLICLRFTDGERCWPGSGAPRTARAAARRPLRQGERPGGAPAGLRRLLPPALPRPDLRLGAVAAG